MKKKILLLVSLIAVLACVFALSISAAEADNSKGTVTLDDGTVCALWDTEGNPLIWYLAGTDESGDNIYNYVDATSSAVDYNGGYSASTGGVKWYQLSSVTVTVDDVSYDKYKLVVLNLQSDNVKITSGQNIGQHVNCLSKTFTGSTTLEYAYLPLDTVDINGEVFKSCAALKYVNLSELTELREIGSQDFNLGSVKQFMANQVLDLSNTKITAIAVNGFACCSAIEIILPETLTSVGGDVFKNCKYATKITFKGTLTSVSTSNLFSGCEALEEIVGFTIPAGATGIGGSMLYKCYELENAGDFIVDGVMTIPDTVTSIGQNAFYGCAKLKAVKMPSKLTNINAEAFRDCTALEFVDFGNNTAESFQFSAHRTFYNCGELRAISLPVNTQYMNNGTFALCKKLQAFYLGNAIIQINGNKGDGAGDGPTFAECEKMYFVNEAFSVTKEDGTFYTTTEFEELMPEKPEIYYFPSTLKRICGAHNVNGSFTMDENGHVKNVGAGDLAFVKCYNLNKYLVFPEGFTGVDESIQSGNDATENPDQRGDTLGTGLFHNCATAQNPITLVFMGQIHRLSFDRRNGQTSYMTYMFANPANTSFENTTIGTYIGDSYYSNQNEMYVIFCHAENGAQKYKINFVKSDADANVPVLTPTLQENLTANDLHVKVTKVVVEISCTTPEKTYYTCFCGIDHNEEITQEAKGHAKTTIVEIAYNSANRFFEKGDITYTCGDCGEEHTVANDANVIFTFVGFSATEKVMGTNAIIQSFKVDRDALALYNQNSELDVVGYGLVAGTELALGENAEIFDNTGAVTSPKAGVVKISENVNNYDVFEMRVSGLNGTVEVEGQDPIDLTKVKVYCCGYCLIQTPSGVASYYANNGTVTETLSGATSYEALQQ